MGRATRAEIKATRSLDMRLLKTDDRTSDARAWRPVKCDPQVLRFLGSWTITLGAPCRGRGWLSGQQLRDPGEARLRRDGGDLFSARSQHGGRRTVRRAEADPAQPCARSVVRADVPRRGA